MPGSVWRRLCKRARRRGGRTEGRGQWRERRARDLVQSDFANYKSIALRISKMYVGMYRREPKDSQPTVPEMTSANRCVRRKLGKHEARYQAVDQETQRTNIPQH